ncbi:hypothetical protein [Actinoallomurus sp. NBC_01490]|uniref:hypothetical protein n=1 Tax=Actinoallomurus sp. NBC_01490 TaxID=2903557 RepID=UPI003FA486B0
MTRPCGHSPRRRRAHDRGGAAGRRRTAADHGSAAGAGAPERVPRSTGRNRSSGGPERATRRVYKRVGAGGTVARPTRVGPAMIFNGIVGHPGARVLVGLMASRERVGILLDMPSWPSSSAPRAVPSTTAGRGRPRWWRSGCTRS